MAIRTYLERAAKPRVWPSTRPSAELGIIAPWQNAIAAELGLPPTWPPTSDYPLVPATEDQAIGLPVIGAFLETLTALVMQMPLHAYRDPGDVGGDTRRVTDPPIIATPMPGHTLGEFVSTYVRDVALHGNYLAVFGPADESGFPEFLYPVPCNGWSVTATDDLGNYEYRIGTTTYQPNEVLHIRRNVCTGDLVGRGILELYRDLIASCVAAEHWSASYFDGGAVPPAQIEHPNPDLTQDMADIMKAKFKLAARRHEVVVTPQGTIMHPLNSNAEDAQLEQTRKANNQALAMACGIPGALLGLDAPSLTYRNIVDVLQQFITTTVMGYLVPLEQSLSTHCLPANIRAAFGTSAVLRPDLETRVDIAVKGLAAGIFDLNEARQYFDLTGAGGSAAEFGTIPPTFNAEVQVDG